MILQDGLTQVLYVYMGINLSGDDILMPKQLLDDTQVCPILQQMRSKTMAKCMRRNNLLNTCLGGKSADNGKYHIAC